MQERKIIVEENVNEEIFQIKNYITNQFSAPLTAKRFALDLGLFIAFIGRHPGIYPLNYYEQLRRYGSPGLRKATFRDKWVVLFETDDDFVYIKKILHTSMIIG